MILWQNRIITSALLLYAVFKNVSSINFYSGNNFEFLYESKLILKSLEEVVKYLEKRPDIATIDVVLGVLIAKANLSWINNRLKYYLSSSYWVNERLEPLLRQSSAIIELNTSYYNFSLLEKSLRETTAENLKFGHLNQFDEDFFLPEFDTCQSIDAYLMKGTPEDSDLCINELIHSNCQISEYCWLSEVNGDSHFGYKTSHRLLYFQILSRMKCFNKNREKFSSVGKIKKKLCQQMLFEAGALYERPTLYLTKDLFMEQIALCGFEGYEEFAPATWRQQVRKWQNKDGCFGLNSKNCSIDSSDKKNETQIIKRTDSAVDDCHTHVTAVALPALSFFLRVTLKMAFRLPEEP